MENSKGRLLAHLGAIICVIAWGSSVVAGKLLMDTYTPVEMIVIRFVLAYITLCIMCPHFKKLDSTRDELLCVLGGFIGISVFYVVEYSALPLTTTSNVSIILALSPITTVIVNKLFDKNLKINRFFPVGMVISIVGVILVVTQGDIASAKGGLVGDLMIVVSITCWSFYLLIVKNLNKYSTMLITKKIFGYGVVTLIPFALLMGFSPDWSGLLSIRNDALFLYIGLLGSAISYFIWNKAVGILGAVKVDPYKYAMPVVTIIFSIIFLGESINIIGVVGVCVTLIGLVITNKK